MSKTINPMLNARRQGRRENAARILAGVMLSLLGAAGLAVTMLATFARGPFDRPLLILGIGSALLFTGGGVCLLLIGAAMILNASASRPSL